MYALIEQGKTLIHCGNTIFIHYNDFSKYMNVEGATSKDVSDYILDIRAKKCLSEKGKNIFINYLKNGIQSIFSLIKILTII